MVTLFRRYFFAQNLRLLLVALAVNAAGAEEIPMGTLIMQLRSTVDAEAAELNLRVEAVTTNYLNQYFDAYYTRTEQGAIDYFEKVDISTSSFGVHGVESSYITTLEIEGTLSFNSGKLPSSFFIETLLRNAFKGNNEKLFLDQLLKEKEEKFLQNLTYLIIDVNEDKVAESPILEDAPALDTTSNNSIEEPEITEKFVFSAKWITAMIYVASGAFALMLLACVCHLHRQCRAARKMKENDTDDEEPMKVITLPIKKKQSSSAHDHDDVNRRISPTSNGTTPTSAGSISDHMDRPPPSPQRSMSSQCSSIFTYSDNMSRMSRIANNKANNDILSKAPSLSSYSKFSLDMPSIDLGTWRGGREDPPEFGSDISVIESKKDLSLIAEERCDIEAGLQTKNNSNSSRRNSITSSRHISRNSRAALDVRQSQARSSHRSETYFYNGSHLSDNDSDSDCPLDTSTGDVICDLKNLSIQIERKRNGRRSRQSVHR